MEISVKEVIQVLEETRNSPISPYNNPSHPDWEKTNFIVELLQEYLGEQCAGKVEYARSGKKKQTS